MGGQLRAAAKIHNSCGWQEVKKIEKLKVELTIGYHEVVSTIFNGIPGTQVILKEKIDTLFNKLNLGGASLKLLENLGV